MKFIYKTFIFFSILFLSVGLFLMFFFAPRGAQIGNENTDKSGKKSFGRRENFINIFNEENDPVTILVLGIDDSKVTYQKDSDSKRSDTIMLLTIDPKRNKVQLLSIPRDTYYKIKGYDNYKINAAFSRGGLKLAIKTIEEFTNRKIDHYITVEYNAIKELVDAIGGIDIYTPEYKYEDPSTIPPLIIDFEEGMHHLNGEDSVKYLRMRKVYEGDQDVERIKAQQGFLMKVFEKINDPKIILKVPKLVGIANRNLDTDLSYGELSYLATYATTLEKEDIEMKTAPGYSKYIGKLSYYISKKEDVRYILQEFLNREESSDTSQTSSEKLEKRNELKEKAK